MEGTNMEDDTVYVAPRNLAEYIRQYSGHARFNILLRLSKNNIALRSDALKMVYNLAKEENKLK